MHRGATRFPSRATPYRIGFRLHRIILQTMCHARRRGGLRSGVEIRRVWSARRTFFELFQSQRPSHRNILLQRARRSATFEPGRPVDPMPAGSPVPLYMMKKRRRDTE
jgi:hypothetical protein